MNQSRFSRFADAVAEGKVPGMECVLTESGNVILTLQGHPIANQCYDFWHFHNGKFGLDDILCAHIRRLLVDAGWDLELRLGQYPCLAISLDEGDLLTQEAFGKCSELDWHIAAWLAYLDKEAAKQEGDNS